MGFQSFSQKMELAKAFAKAKAPTSAVVDQAEKERRKQVAKVRADRRVAENLAQRALVESRRCNSATPPTSRTSSKNWMQQLQKQGLQ
jgi:hypothetical protein